MAIRIYCDVCHKEMTSEIMGKLVFTERTTRLISFNNKKDKEGLIRKEYDICPDCIKICKEALKI